MKEIKSFYYNLEYAGLVSKEIILVELSKVYYVWIQDYGVSLNKENIIKSANRTKNIKVAEEIFEFYKYFLERIDLNQYNSDQVDIFY